MTENTLTERANLSHLMKLARFIMIALLRVRRLQKPLSNDSLDAKKSRDYKPTTTESEFEKSVEEEIEQARSELTTVVLAKQKEVVCRMEEALEKIRKGERRHSICEELKNRLRAEIARRIISERTIEITASQNGRIPRSQGQEGKVPLPRIGSIVCLPKNFRHLSETTSGKARR